MLCHVSFIWQVQHSEEELQEASSTNVFWEEEVETCCKCMSMSSLGHAELKLNFKRTEIETWWDRILDGWCFLFTVDKQYIFDILLFQYVIQFIIVKLYNRK